jgi:hypothetical protein
VRDVVAMLDGCPGGQSRDHDVLDTGGAENRVGDGFRSATTRSTGTEAFLSIAVI